MKARQVISAAEPFTPRGVAAFAQGTVFWLWILQLMTAVVVAISVLWFFTDSCVPAVQKAIANITGSGEIRSGELNWNGDPPKMLAEERFLAFDVDLDHSGEIHLASDLQVEFGRNTIRVFSLPGHKDFRYPYLPPDKVIKISRLDLEPRWGAWLPEIQAILAAVVLVGLILIWNILATIYAVPIWIIGLLARRELRPIASWRLAGGALLPGGLLLALGIFFFDFGVLDLVRFCFLVCASVVLGWIYLFTGLCFVPRRAVPEVKPVRRNPFMRHS